LSINKVDITKRIGGHQDEQDGDAGCDRGVATLPPSLVTEL
jgi:hypothetical protein